MTSFNPNLCREILTVNAELEGLAIRMSAPYMDRLMADKLQPIYDEMKKCAAEPHHRVKITKLDHKFYLSIYSAAPHPILDELLISYWSRIEFFKSCCNYLESPIENLLGSYRACLELMRVENALEASGILRTLKEDSIARFLAEIERQGK